jgi:hypothetical protein
MKHKWFRRVEWEAVRKHQIPVPYKPIIVGGADDISNFDTYPDSQLDPSYPLRLEDRAMFLEFKETLDMEWDIMAKKAAEEAKKLEEAMIKKAAAPEAATAGKGKGKGKGTGNTTGGSGGRKSVEGQGEAALAPPSEGGATQGEGATSASKTTSQETVAPPKSGSSKDSKEAAKPAADKASSSKKWGGKAAKK